MEARETLDKLVQGLGATVTVVEMPPGPPVLQSVVAEVHGPNAETRRQVARDLTAFFKQAESLVDVDNYMQAPYEYWRFDVDDEKASRRGITVEAINRNLAMALGSAPLGDVKQRAGQEPINIVMQVPLAERSQLTRLGDLPMQNQMGVTLPLRELGKFERVLEDHIVYHKDLRGVEYVVADVGGRLAAPVYGMLQVQDILREQNYVTPDGVNLMEDGRSYWIGAPPDDIKTGFEWAGEWTVTYETFRDMGAAFAVALVLIYMLVVWEFGNFRIPALIMAPIPLTLLGIVPAHMFFFQFGEGGEFTATSMIGWIALAGIIVRNSILLVDFSIHEVQAGVPVRDAVIKACKTRTRPILITALALVAGSSVILTDPIFQGMAISLASGVLVSTVLTLVVIPLGTIEAKQSLIEVAAAGLPPGETLNIAEEDREAVSEPVAVEPGKRRGGKLMAIWGAVASVLMMVFYAIRGLVLLLLQFFRAKRRPATPPQQGEPPAGGGGAAPASPAPGAGPAASAPAAASAAAATAVEPAPEPARRKAPPPPKREMRLRPGPGKQVTDEVREEILSRSEPFEPLGGEKASDVIQVSEASADDLAFISAPINRPEEELQKASRSEVTEAAPRESGQKRPVAAKSKPRAKAKTGARAKTGTKKKAVAKPPARAAANEPSAKPAAGDEQPARAARKASRRGIRLKDKLPGKTDLGLG